MFIQYAKIVFLSLLLLPSIALAQPYTFSPARGCGLGSTTGANPPIQSYGTPGVYSWTWGLDGRFSNISGTAEQKNFYNWAKDPTKSGEYVLARVHYDINSIKEGRIISDGGSTSSLSCYSQGVGIRFLPKTRSYSTEETLGIYMDYLNEYNSTSVTFSTTIGGVSVVGKQMGALKRGHPSMIFGVAAYFNMSRNIGSGGTIGLPSTPTIVSGGQVPRQAQAYYLLGGGVGNYSDAVIPGAFDGWGRIGACATQSNNAFCTYGVVPSLNPKPSFAENKSWKFDYVVYKPAGVSYTMPAMTDKMLPYIAIGRLYVFGTNNVSNYGLGSSPQQTALCIAGMAAYPNTGPQGCATVAPTDPPPPAPVNATCYTELRGGTVQAGNTIATNLDDVVLTDFTGIGSGFRYTQGTGTNKRVEIGLTCINNNNTIPNNVSLNITEISNSCNSAIPNRIAQGVLCNTASNTFASPSATSVHIQVYRALRSSPTLACSAINSLTNTSNANFQPLPIGQTVNTAALASSYYSPAGDPNTYLWQFCARYYVRDPLPTGLYYGGNVKGQFNFTFNYD